jgi:hypothetical protein
VERTEKIIHKGGENMTQTIEIVRGTSNTFPITVTDADGTPYTLEAGEKLLFGVKKQPSDKDYLVLKTITATTNGEYVAKLLPNDTSGMEYGRYVYDVGLESGENFYNVIEASPFVVQPNVTKWGDGS